MNKPEIKNILKTSFPAAIDLASQPIMWMVEAIFIGQLGAAALGGYGMALQVLIVTFTCLLPFIVGSTLIILRHLGANENWEANHLFSQVVMVGILASFVLAFSWWFFGPLFFKLIKDIDRSAQQAGVNYLKTVALFAPLVIANFVAVGVLRGVGDTKITMMINIVINLINIILSPLLIFGIGIFPRLETTGAGLAVGISHSVGFFITLWIIRSRKTLLYLSFRELATPNYQSIKKLFITGITNTIEQLSWAIGQMVVSGYAARLGVVVLAVHQLFLRVQSVLSMFYHGFGLSAMAMVGKNIGAKDKQLAESTGMMVSKIMFISVLPISILMILFSKEIFHLFTNDGRVIALGVSVITTLALVQIPRAMNIAVSGNLRGVGDLQWLMWLTIVAVLIFHVFASWAVVFIFNFSLLGLWLVQGGDETLRFAMSFWRFKVGKWK